MSNSTQNNVSWINANFCPHILPPVPQNLPNLNVITNLPIPFGFVIFPGLYSCFEISPPPPFPHPHAPKNLFLLYIEVRRSFCARQYPIAYSVRPEGSTHREKWHMTCCVIVQFRTSDHCTQLSKHSDFDATPLRLLCVTLPCFVLGALRRSILGPETGYPELEHFVIFRCLKTNAA